MTKLKSLKMGAIILIIGAAFLAGAMGVNPMGKY